ncbi:hypothetical protein B9Z55_024245 [Caenorhabditis nigoni]|nr:hypothetical protein B9Z55_024245 [Caenorhabditis nigoni]
MWRLKLPPPISKRLEHVPKRKKRNNKRPSDDTDSLEKSQRFAKLYSVDEMSRITLSPPDTENVNLSKIQLNLAERHNDLLQFLSTQKNIESLVLNVHMTYPRYFNIIEFLNRSLNAESRTNLKSLLLGGDAGSFFLGWEQQIIPIFPALISIDFGHQRIPTETLIRISVSHQNVESLKMIIWGFPSGVLEKFKNITTLHLIDTTFTSKEQISELFQLKKLQSLSLAGKIHRKIKSVRLFVECGDTLPDLKYLDASCNDITEDIVQKLADSHPNLKHLCVLDTPLMNTVSIQTSSTVFKLLSVGDLKTCIHSLKYAEQSGYDWNEIKVITAMKELFQSLPIEKQLDDIENCSKTLVDLLYRCAQSIRRYSQMTQNILDCFLIICSDARIDNIALADRIHLLETLLSLPQGFRYFSQGFRYFSTGFRYFSQAFICSRLIHTIPETVKENRLAKALRELGKKRMYWTPAVDVQIELSIFYLKHTKNQFTEFKDFRNLLDLTQTWTKWTENINHPKTKLADFIEIIYKIDQRCLKKSLSLAMSYCEVLILFVEDNPRDSHITEVLFVALEEFARQSGYIYAYHLFGGSWTNMFILSLRRENYMVTDLLLFLYNMWIFLDADFERTSYNTVSCADLIEMQQVFAESISKFLNFCRQDPHQDEQLIPLFFTPNLCKFAHPSYYLFSEFMFHLYNEHHYHRKPLYQFL